MKKNKRTIYFVATVPTGGIVRKIINKIIIKTKILPPLHRCGIDFFIPWKKPLRSPHASSRNILHNLKQFGRVRFYSLYEKGCITLQPNDIFIGHPVAKGGFSYESRPEEDERDSVVSNTLRKNRDNHNKYIILPFANDIKLVSWAKDLVENYADKIIIIGGEIWTRDWKNTPFGKVSWDNVLRLDNGIDPEEYPRVKFSFNPPQKRKFLYIGHCGWYKNTKELERIAEQMPGFEGGHIGAGSVKGWKKIADFADLTPEFMSKIAKEYDIFVTVSTADAQATTIMENTCFGFPIACTPETGYEAPSIIRLDTGDTAGNITKLLALKNADEAVLLKYVEENLAYVKKNHSWKTSVDKINDFTHLSYGK